MKLFVVLVALALPHWSNGAQKVTRGRLSAGDYRFVEQAAQGGLTKVMVGELAQQKGASAEVRNFGERMVADHGKINQELRRLAQSKGARLPSELTGKHRWKAQQLFGLSGAAFDKAYAEYALKDHKQDVKRFQKAVKHLQDSELKSFAVRTLPVIQEHLRLAGELRDAVRAK